MQFIHKPKTPWMISWKDWRESGSTLDRFLIILSSRMVMTWELCQKNVILKNIPNPNTQITSWDGNSLLRLDLLINLSSSNLPCTIPNRKKESGTWKGVTFPTKKQLCFWTLQWSHFLETLTPKQHRKQ